MLKKILYVLLLILLCAAGAVTSFVITEQMDNADYKEGMSKTSLHVVSAEDQDLSGQILEKGSIYADCSDGQKYSQRPSADTAVPRTERAVLQLTDNEIYLFDCIVECEAGNEPYDGMVGVADVIINRIKSTEFPDTLEDVIYDPGQFSPVDSGMLDSVLASGPSEACIQAVQDALYGENVIGDFLYFKMDFGGGTEGISDYIKIGTTIFYNWY